MSNTKEIWQKYQNRDHLTTEELQVILNDAKASLPYLEGNWREFYLAVASTMKIISNIESAINSRSRK